MPACPQTHKLNKRLQQDTKTSSAPRSRKQIIQMHQCGSLWKRCMNTCARGSYVFIRARFAEVCAEEVCYVSGNQEGKKQHSSRFLGRMSKRRSSTQSLREAAHVLYTEIYSKNARAQNRGPHFVRACAIEMHINMSEEPFYTEICRKSAAPCWGTLIKQ